MDIIACLATQVYVLAKINTLLQEEQDELDSRSVEFW